MINDDREVSTEKTISDDTVLFSIEDGLATITLNRPDKLNSLNSAMHGRLRDLLRQISSDRTVRAVLLTANGRAFCSGQDLTERKQSPDGTPPDLGQTIETNWNPLARALHYLKVPVVCAVNGIAAGAGVSLALGCDIVIAARSASFLLSFSKVGLIPDAGGTYLLPRLVGNARAVGLAMLGPRLTAVDAQEWGLIWQCVEDSQLAQHSKDLAKSLANGPTTGLASVKLALRESFENSFEDQLELERRTQQKCGFSDDYREGVTAFLEKRAPDFKGM